jgi:hypothetical protein
MELVDFLRIIYKLTTKYGISGFLKEYKCVRESKSETYILKCYYPLSQIYDTIDFFRSFDYSSFL